VFYQDAESAVAKDESNPVVVVIPGLTSDSFSPVSCCL